jgi:flagellar protein FlaJ
MTGDEFDASADGADDETEHESVDGTAGTDEQRTGESVDERANESPDFESGEEDAASAETGDPDTRTAKKRSADGSGVTASPKVGAPDGPGPSYGVTGFPEVREVTEAERERVREEYGRLRSYYKLRPEKYRDFQRRLNQARMGTSYDVYLANSARYAVVTALVGVLVGAVLSMVLSNYGVIPQFRNPIQSFRGDFVRYLGRNRALFTSAILTILLTTVLTLTVWYGRYVYPRSIADSRRRNIDVTLPHAITFMYALSYGGTNLLDVIHTLGEAEETYGEVAAEFEMIARDVELFGNDMFTAIRNARNLTPSDNLEQFLDDLLAVLDSGGNVTEFFRSETNTYLEEAREEQENFLETLSLMAEFFIVVFVAAPLFIIVILMVISLLGGQTLTQLTLLIYAILPLGMLGFLVLLDTLSEPYRQPKLSFDRGEMRPSQQGVLALVVLRDTWNDLLDLLGSLVGTDDESSLSRDERRERQHEAYERQQRRRRLAGALDDPLAMVRRRPLLTLVVSAPLAALVLIALVLTGQVQPTVGAFETAPLQTTTLLLVLPLLLTIVPVSVFHELKRRRDNSLARKFPDTLNVLSSANKMGIELTDALSLVARWSRGPLAMELRKVRNDIRWNFDTRSALLDFADRLEAPQLARTLKLIAEGTRSTSDLARVLSVAAEDTRERFKIQRKRQNELSSYVAVVVIGFLVYLLVVVILDASYLEPIANTPQPAPGPDGRSVPLTVASVPVEAYRTLFFHSALVQGVGVGLLAGKLANDDVLSGLKYSIALVALTLVVFTLI